MSEFSPDRLAVPIIIRFDNCNHVYHFGAVTYDSKEVYIPMFLKSDCKKQKPGKPRIFGRIESNSDISYPVSIGSIHQDIMDNYIKDYPSINKLANNRISFIHPDIIEKERLRQIEARKKRETEQTAQQAAQQVVDSVQGGLNNLFGLFGNLPTEVGGD